MIVSWAKSCHTSFFSHLENTADYANTCKMNKNPTPATCYTGHTQYSTGGCALGLSQEQVLSAGVSIGRPFQRGTGRIINRSNYRAAKMHDS